MASTIQVDKITDIGGNTIISSNGSGTFTSNLPASGATLTGSTNNQVVTVTGANAISGESGLIFDGSKLGIGTSTMTRTLNVTDATSGASTGIQLIGANNGTQFINFGDTDDTNVGEINYDHGLNKMNFRTNDAYAMVIDSTGAVTKPKQPAFLVNNDGNSAQTLNNNSLTTVGLANEIFDTNADFASNTFTAPVTGKYQINAQVNVDAGSSSNTRFQQFGIQLTFSNRNIRFFLGSQYTDEYDRVGQAGSVICDMDANDTLVVQAYASRASGTGTTAIIVSSQYACWMSGYLVA